MVPENYECEKIEEGKRLKHIMGCWFTNLKVKKHNEFMMLHKKYTSEAYPKYDNYDAVEVSKVAEIPADWDGVMGVPITFVDQYNPQQFAIIGLAASAGYEFEIVGLEKKSDIKDARPLINGKNTYARVFIKRKAKNDESGDIEKYMSIHQHDPNANELWTYFRSVIEWVKLTFTVYRKEMKGIDWGKLYDEYGKKMIDTAKLEQEIQSLMMDDDVTSKKGIYPYVLTREEKLLNIRKFTDSQKRTVYEKSKGICSKCGNHFELREMEADHITPWSKGGKTNLDNCQILCQDCNRQKSDI
jgi:hypothetical protein